MLAHYIPRFLLKRFTDANNKYWVLDKESKRFKYGSPKSTFVKEDLYMLPDQLADVGPRPEQPESLLAEQERRAARIIKKTIEPVRDRDEITLRRKDLEDLHIFLNCLLYRQPDTLRYSFMFHQVEMREQEKVATATCGEYLSTRLNSKDLLAKGCEKNLGCTIFRICEDDCGFIIGEPIMGNHRSIIFQPVAPNLAIGLNHSNAIRVEEIGKQEVQQINEDTYAHSTHTASMEKAWQQRVVESFGHIDMEEYVE